MEFKTKINGFCFVCDKLNLANTEEWRRRSTKLLSNMFPLIEMNHCLFAVQSATARQWLQSIFNWAHYSIRIRFLCKKLITKNRYSIIACWVKMMKKQLELSIPSQVLNCPTEVNGYACKNIHNFLTYESENYHRFVVIFPFIRNPVPTTSQHIFRI